LPFKISCSQKVREGEEGNYLVFSEGRLFKSFDVLITWLLGFNDPDGVSVECRLSHNGGFKLHIFQPFCISETAVSIGIICDIPFEWIIHGLNGYYVVYLY